MSAGEAGFAGKLPSHDDFVEGGGALEARHRLMDWAKAGLVRGRDGSANRFTDMFLTMPVWRFVLEPGLCTEHTVAGVLCPSVDRSGRAFPIVIVAELEPCDALTAFAPLREWFEAMEALVLNALDGSLDAGAFGQGLAPPPASPGPWRGERPFRTGLRSVAVDAAGIPNQAVPSAAYWTTTGGEDVPPLGLSHSAPPDDALFLALVAAEQAPERR